MKLYNPFSLLTRFEWILWLLSVTVVTCSFFFGNSDNALSIFASLVGVTALIFVAKGNVYGQVLTVIFSLLYAAVSWQFKYYGEMITYLGMTTPIALMSVVTWLRNPCQGETPVVKVAHLSRRMAVLMILYSFYSGPWQPLKLLRICLCCCVFLCFFAMTFMDF